MNTISIIIDKRDKHPNLAAFTIHIPDVFENNRNLSRYVRYAHEITHLVA
jgi:hypothetical protein